MSKANKICMSKNRMVCAIILSIVVFATTIVTTKARPTGDEDTTTAAAHVVAVDLVVDVDAHDDEEIDPDHECKHAEMMGELVQQIMEVVEGGGNVMTLFHQDGDYPFSFTADDIEVTEETICFGLTDDGKFCLELARSGVDVASVVTSPNDGSRRLDEEGRGNEVDDSGNGTTFNFNFSLFFFIIFQCFFCPTGANLYTNDAFRKL